MYKAKAPPPPLIPSEGDLTTQYGTGYMQQNPSYNYQGGGGYYYDQGPALDAYEGRSYEQGRRKKTGTSSEGEGLQPTRDFEYHDQYPGELGQRSCFIAAITFHCVRYLHTQMVMYGFVLCNTIYTV